MLNNDSNNNNNKNNNNNNNKIIIMMMMMMMMMMIIIMIMMMMMMKIIIIIIIIIIVIIILAFKGAVRIFLQSPHCASNRLQHVRSSGQGAIVCKSRATHRALITCNRSSYVPRGMKGQLSY